MSVDISQFRALAGEIGITVIPSNYREEALTYPQFCEVLPPDAASTPLYGDVSTTVYVGADPQETQDSQAYPTSTGGEGYQPMIKITPYKQSIRIPRRLMATLAGRARAEGLVSNFLATQARAAAVIKETSVYSLINRGSITAGDKLVFDGAHVGHEVDPNIGKIYDGSTFFSATHAPKMAPTSTRSNILTTTLSGPNLDAAYTLVAMTNAVDERAKPIAIAPEFLIVPTALRSTAQILLGSDQAPGSGNNDINTNRGLLKLIVSRYMTTADSWAVGTSGAIRVFDSGAPEMVTWEDEEHDSYCVGVKFLFGRGVREWRGWAGSRLPTS